MRVFDIGFYDGQDSHYYLERGFEVIAFEANPILFETGQNHFAEAIASGQLQLHNLGIGAESGNQVDFFIHNDSEEWSTFYREAAINWGIGKSRITQVPCITPKEMFAQFGCPDYLKSDIEGFDILVADELQNLTNKPSLVSFEASNIRLLKSLVLAGYQSFKMVDQTRVPLQVVKDEKTSIEFRFRGGTGPFGDDAEGEWLSFENAHYLFFRFVHDPFSSSTPEGHWFDIHASTKPPGLNEGQQRDYLLRLIGKTYNGHCGMKYSNFTPHCPVKPLAHSIIGNNEIDLLRKHLGAIQSSLEWKLAWRVFYLANRIFSFFRRVFESK